MRVVVVGAGVVGLVSAVEAARAGHDVIVLERDTVPSARAASHDPHRILRSFPGPVEAGRHLHTAWTALQEVLGAPVYRPVGALTVLGPAPPPAPAWQGTRATLTPEDLLRRYPTLRLPAASGAVLERDAGVLLARKVLHACLAWLRDRPHVTVRDGAPVARVDAERARVRTADGIGVSGDVLLVTAGAWTRHLVAARPSGELTLWRQTSLYCRLPAAERARWAAMPAVPSLGTPEGAWLVPPVDGTPLKLSAASACRAVRDHNGRQAPPRWREHLLQVFRPLVPGLEPRWVSAARDCYYVQAGGAEGPSVLRIGERASAVLACGGTGFKWAPLLAHQMLGSTADPPGGIPHDPTAHMCAPPPANSHQPTEGARG